MIDSSLLPDFIAEASEHLDEMEINLIKLESDPGNREVLDDIFRAMHTIKGSSKYMGLNITSELTHKIESLLEILRQERISATPELIDTLIAARDRIVTLVTDLEHYQEERTKVDDLVDLIDHYTSGLVLAETDDGDGKEVSSVHKKEFAEPPVSVTPVAEKLPEKEELHLDLDGINLDLSDFVDNLQTMENSLEQESSESEPSSPAEQIVAEFADHTETREPQPSDHVNDSSGSDDNLEDDESYDESGDEELFGIFLEQLKDTLLEIQNQASNFSGSDQHSELLSGIVEKVEKLKVPANYMGYDKLIELCDRWLAVLETFHDQLFSGSEVAVSTLFDTGLNPFINKILNKFPQIEGVIVVPVPIEDFVGTQESIPSDAPPSVDDEDVNEKSDSLSTVANEAQGEPGIQSSVYLDDDQNNLDSLAPTFEATCDDSENSGGFVDETGDEELFTIFLEQLKENLLEIQSLILQSPASEHDSELLFNEITENIKQLRASANYMGYDKLIDLYDRWMVQLEDCQNVLFSGEQALSSSGVTTAINPYIEDILLWFPQLEGVTIVPVKNETHDQLESQLDNLSHDDNEDSFTTSVEEDPLDEEVAPAEDLKGTDSTSDFEIVNHFSDVEAQVEDTVLESVGEVEAEFSEEDPTAVVENLVEDIDNNQGDAGSYLPLEKDRSLVNELTQEELETGSAVDDEAESEPEDRTAEFFSTEEYSDDEESPSEIDLKPIIDESDAKKEQTLIDSLSLALDKSFDQSSDAEKTVVSNNWDIAPHLKDRSKESNEAEVSSEAEAKRVTEDTAAGPKDIGQHPSTSLATSLGEKNKPRVADKVVKQSLRIDSNKIDDLMNQTSELVMNRAWFAQLTGEMKGVENYLQDTFQLDKKDTKQVKNLTSKFEEATVALGRVASGLQDGVMKVRMLPISKLYNRYPRLVRDLVRDTDKDIELEIRGADTELDKMIIEEISDPLIHIIRNAVDHGIELRDTRKKLGKPAKGLLRLDAYHEGSHVVVEVTDDGKGIAPETVKAAALKKGLVSRDELSHMSAKEVVELIMKPGFSTTDHITRTSGRGVGMDVVKRNLEKLNGSIEIDSKPGKETRIRIKIPLTLAVIKALLVKVRRSLFTIPLIAVDETLKVRSEDINSIKGNEVIYLRDSTIPLIRLAKLFNLQTEKPQRDSGVFVVIVSIGNRRVGLVVDELCGKEEVVIKPLPDYLKDSKGFSGATILGDGSISLILDVAELVQLTIGRQSRMRDQVNRRIRESA